MRSGLQPVAISCHKDYGRAPFAPPGDARACSEVASDASNVLEKTISMQDRELRTICVLRSSYPGFCITDPAIRAVPREPDFIGAAQRRPASYLATLLLSHNVNRKIV